MFAEPNDRDDTDEAWAEASVAVVAEFAVEEDWSDEEVRQLTA